MIDVNSDGVISEDDLVGMLTNLGQSTDSLGRLG